MAKSISTVLQEIRDKVAAKEFPKHYNNDWGKKWVAPIVPTEERTITYWQDEDKE